MWSLQLQQQQQKTQQSNKQQANLIKEVADVVVAQSLGFQQLVQVGLHQALKEVIKLGLYFHIEFR